MHKVYLSLGSNIGDREGNLQKAFEYLKGKVNLLKIAKIYETKAMHYKNQPDFLNTAILVETNLKPLELLSFIKDVEKSIGRKYTFRWGPREIDIDILYYDDLIYKDKVLEIPHPRINERDFVKTPLAEIWTK